jgi:sortase (surface protein transpeptidase)
VRSLSTLSLLVAFALSGAPGATIARQPTTQLPRPPAALAPVVTAATTATTATGSSIPHRFLILDAVRRRVMLTGSAAPAPAAAAVDWIIRPTPAVPKAVAKKASTATSSSAKSGSHKGRNHVWIPALGIDRSISFFSCSSSAYPGNRVYRWGCAGSNNVYLFGHAHSVFKALHDAYVRGRLAKGMKVIYANGAGRVSTYAVSWWKLTTPDNGAWAFASQSSPSLTLQTCVGANNKYRLIVRLRKVG